MKLLRTADHKRLMKMLANARRNAGLSQQQLAEQIGGRRNFISRYENGERRPDFLEGSAVSRPGAGKKR